MLTKKKRIMTKDQDNWEERTSKHEEVTAVAWAQEDKMCSCKSIPI